MRKRKITALCTLFILLCVLSSEALGQPLASLNEGKHTSARKLRYHPDGEDFVIVNGDRKFNRALYGSHSGFRLETSDVPEFALYLPRMGGNLTLGLRLKNRVLSLNHASRIESRYRAGSRIYKITDPILGKNGVLVITALALPDTDGAIWKIESKNIPSGIELTWLFGGAADKRFSREGDMGVDPADCFDLKPEYCSGNVYAIKNNQFQVAFGQKSKTGARVLSGLFPSGSKLTTDELPRLHGSVLLQKEQYFLLHSGELSDSPVVLSALFDKAEKARRTLAERIRISTPDPYFNTLGGALSVAADGIWDGEVWLHGAIGWRMPLSGWRAAYTGDVLGWHDRARKHFDAYAASQVTHKPQVKQHPAQDPEMNLARSIKEWGTPQYSNGYICRNPNRNDQMHHYDMNLCYTDELLWHFNWTGDLAYARKMWPVLVRHLDWEKRNFDPDNDGLYDAYACIWASDALYYNSGAVTHSSAYNYRANKMAAEIARLIGEDPTPYASEATQILKAMNEQLWIPSKGHWAEYKDFMGHKRVHESAALWTVYHAIDSETADPFQAYQATRYVDTAIPHIPVRAEGLKDEQFETISTTNWLPYSWSINNVAFAEVMHTSLAYWQAGRNDEAFKLLKSSVLDGMYLGGSPGNFGQVSFYDAARGECYRDFGDPIGVASRALIQGLYGIVPDLLNNRLLLRPGFPVEWPYASLETPDISFGYQQEGPSDVYRVSTRFDKPLTIELQCRARMDRVVTVTVNGKKAQWKQNETSVGYPCLLIEIPSAKTAEIKIEWAGRPVEANLFQTGKTYKKGDVAKISFQSLTMEELYDPQNVFLKTRIPINPKEFVAVVTGAPGGRTAFARVRQGDLSWWLPIEIQVEEESKDAVAAFSKVVSAHCRPVNMDSLWNAPVTAIFKNEYLTPRSPYTTLQLPKQGIGEWCHPKTTAVIDDSGLRKKVRNQLFATPFGVNFRTPSEGNNIAFTSLWDNYPDSIRVPLTGSASHAYLLMAGSTNHMQCHIVNGIVKVHYTDGSCDSLELINPENWCPIEQDFFVDSVAFSIKAPRPYRVHLLSGLVSNNLEKDLTIKGVYGREIPGGAGVLLDMPLNPKKTLSHLTLETLSNDVVIGLMSITLQQ